MRRAVMRWISAVSSCMARTRYFFEDRGWDRISNVMHEAYNVVDDLHWKLTQRNIRRLREKQRADVEQRTER